MPSGKELKSEQRRQREMDFLLDADAASPALLVGDPMASLTRNGVGDYTLTFRNAYGRAPICMITGAEDNAMGVMGTRSVSSIQVLIEDASTNAAADLDVVIKVIGWDAKDEV